MQDDSGFGCFLKGLAGVFAALLVVLLPAVLFSFNFPVAFLDANAYKNALEDQNLYPILIDELMNGVLEEELPYLNDYSSEMYQDALDSSLGDIFDEEWLQSETEKVIDDVFEFLNSDATELHTSFSLPSVSERLSGKEGEQIIRNYLDALPPCEPQDLEDFMNYSGNTIPFCSPPDDQIEPYMDEIQSGIIDALEDMEEDMPLDARPTGEELQVLQGYRAFRIVMLVSPVFILFLAGAIMALAVRSIDGLMNWMGIPFGIGSMFALLSAGVLSFYIRADLKEMIADALIEDSAFSVRIANALGGVVDQVVGHYFNWVLIEAGVLLALSLFAIAAGLLYKRMRGES